MKKGVVVIGFHARKQESVRGGNIMKKQIAAGTSIWVFFSQRIVGSPFYSTP
jgi:hypothetical protein